MRSDYLFTDLPDSPLTPLLNAALDVLEIDPELPETTRILFCLWRNSWGNWFPYAVKGRRIPSLDFSTLPDDLRPGLPRFLRSVILGTGNCPWCKRPPRRREQRDIHKEFKWHVRCIAIAYATEAIVMGDDTGKKWARDILRGRNPVGPQKSDEGEDFKDIWRKGGPIQ